METGRIDQHETSNYYQRQIDYYSQLLSEEVAGSKSSRAIVCRRKIREYTELLRSVRSTEGTER